MTEEFSSIRPCVFDAYGTLFDVQRRERLPADPHAELSDLSGLPGLLGL